MTASAFNEAEADRYSLEQSVKDGNAIPIIGPDGHCIVTGSKDTRLRLWPLFKGRADGLCQKLGRNMSHQVWQEWM